MSAKRIDGKLRAQEIHEEVARRSEELRGRGIVPTLAMMRVGEDPASIVYLRKKAEAAEKVGVQSKNIVFPEDANPEEVRQTMQDLNQDPNVHGILLQLPLPKGWDAQVLLNLMDPAKDVDGFHPVSVGKLVRGEPTLLPCTPLGILYLLHREQIDLSGKVVAVIGRSNIVGRPVANLLSQKGPGRDATVILLHSRSKEIPAWTSQADVIIAAAGQAQMITPEMVRPGAVVIDVGIHRVPNPDKPGKFKLVGDVHPDVKEVASAMTPVPGGVGPMTVATLLQNTVDAAE
ncbi:MAG: bifunctional 5,10-methylene-tetrahydrofolate dehydrogenase/5,10-methylene-tetrahydrofolate cyclohydrolase, partial [Candidatus Eisenbacteria bacterium]|nr:bifunctional 5,10-methylene-tetrahydrofolate dehydrogenase/5,10-methylene-tetrahydrofolate cyclohydrolase [Candidatus Eisenbacteria bacterium]